MTDAKAGLERNGESPRRLASVVAFVLLTYAATWALWIGASALDSGNFALAYLPGTIMPGLVALLLAKKESEQAFRDLVARMFRWRVSPWYYLFALMFMAAVKLIAASLYRLGAGEWPAFGTTPLLIMLIAILFSTPVQAGEEIGWRGFMLHRLAERMGIAWASLLVGVIWASWHLPMFFMRGADMIGQSFPLFLLMIVALSVSMAWLYRRTGESLLLTMIMHAAINNTTAIVPSRSPEGTDTIFVLAATPVGWLTTLILWSVAVILFVRLSRRVTKKLPRNGRVHREPDGGL